MMLASVFPLPFGSEEARLLTGIVIGAGFGFALERGGFGNARKLAAQFYLTDMTVFKVMFTAIITAMAGLFTLAGLGWLDLDAVWINPTFLWSQLAGGFLLGIGFIMSGLCPGTSLVSAVSGRVDAMVTFGGIFVGTFLFSVLVGWIAPLDALYHAGSLGVSTLPALLGVSAPIVVLAVIAVAGAGFVGAEAIEKRFSAGRDPLALTPRTATPAKFAVTAALALVVVLGAAAASPRPAAPPPPLPPIGALDLAGRIVEHDPTLLVLDLRSDREAQPPIPGALPAAPDSSALPALASALPGQTTVVVYDDAGTLAAVPAAWPRDLEYRVLRGGRQAWGREVLTPATPTSFTLAEQERVRRQNQLSAFFSGAKLQASTVAAPPPALPSGAAPKKKSGGC